MFSNLFHSKYSRHIIYILLRISIIAIYSLWMLQLNNRYDDFSLVNVPLLVGGVTTVLIIVMMFIKPIRSYVPFIAIITDWVLCGAYLIYFPTEDVFTLSIVALIVTVSTILYVGALFGTIAIVGSLILTTVLIINRQQPPLNPQNLDWNDYLPAIVVSLTIYLVVLIWSYSLDDENDSSRKAVRKEIEASRQEVEEMRERTRLVAEMSTRLNATLNFEHILDAALDMGRMSVRQDSLNSLKSIALLVTSEQGHMTIENSRGLRDSDKYNTFVGEQGILAEALTLGEPIIHDGGSEDPELSRISAFAQVRSTLVIPLRANFETYGALVFGSTGRNSISNDHIDTLSAIGVQVTVALQNAVLYNNLRDEKERILRIEENGRKALVRDLHDIPTQTVSAVAMRLSLLTKIAKDYPERFEDEVKTLREMTLRATEEIRHVMFALRPLSLEASGLTVALGQLADKMQQTYDQTMEIRIDNHIEEVLNDEAKGTLFYLIEEAANNARKYAEASVIKVIGGIKDSEVIIRIGDNGKGFDTSIIGTGYEKRGSFGMVNMQERAELINGTFDLKSAPNKGTVITVRIPIADENRAQSIPLLKPRRPIRKQYSGPISPST